MTPESCRKVPPGTPWPGESTAGNELCSLPSPHTHIPPPLSLAPHHGSSTAHPDPRHEYVAWFLLWAHMLPHSPHSSLLSAPEDCSDDRLKKKRMVTLWLTNKTPSGDQHCSSYRDWDSQEQCTKKQRLCWETIVLSSFYLRWRTGNTRTNVEHCIFSYKFIFTFH